MQHISLKIRGVPYSRIKNRGNVEALKFWTEAVIEQTKSLPKVKEACIMNVTFLLPENKFPSDFPFGPDLDNLLKRFCDALGKTVFSEAKGKDSCVISMNVMKTKVDLDKDAGALLEILPVSVG